MRRAVLLLALLPGAVAVGQAEAPEEGFVSLYDGRTLDGWTGNTRGYVPEAGGKLVYSPGRGSGNLYTEREYGDFVLRFEFKLTPGANNGLGIRTPREGDPAYAGLELQILDDTAPKHADLKPWQYHGSIYGIVPARRGHQVPVGLWNVQEVTCRGPRIVVVLNGTVIVDADVSRGRNHAGRPHAGSRRRSGHIAFCSHGDPLAFRNIRIKEL